MKKRKRGVRTRWPCRTPLPFEIKQVFFPNSKFASPPLLALLSCHTSPFHLLLTRIQVPSSARLSCAHLGTRARSSLGAGRLVRRVVEGWQQRAWTGPRAGYGASRRHAAHRVRWGAVRAHAGCQFGYSRKQPCTSARRQALNRSQAGAARRSNARQLYALVRIRTHRWPSRNALTPGSNDSAAGNR